MTTNAEEKEAVRVHKLTKEKSLSDTPDITPKGSKDTYPEDHPSVPEEINDADDVPTEAAAQEFNMEDLDQEEARILEELAALRKRQYRESIPQAYQLMRITNFMIANRHARLDEIARIRSGNVETPEQRAHREQVEWDFEASSAKEGPVETQDQKLDEVTAKLSSLGYESCTTARCGDSFSVSMGRVADGHVSAIRLSGHADVIEHVYACTE